MKGGDTMAEKKVVVCCGTSAENLGEGLECKVEETDKGYTISVTSDDPEKLEQLKAMMKSGKVEEIRKGFTISVTSGDPETLKQLKEMMKSCCGSGDSKSCC